MDNPFQKPAKTLYGMELVQNEHLPVGFVVLKNGKNLLVVNIETGFAIEIKEPLFELPVPDFQPRCETTDIHGNHCPGSAARRTTESGSFYACDACWSRYLWQREQQEWLRRAADELRKHPSYFLSPINFTS